MRSTLAHCGFVFGLGALATFLLGCASTAEFQTLRPAQAEVTHVRCVAVLKFPGPDDAGQAVQATILSKLRENGYYELVSAEELERYAPAPLYRPNGRVENAAAIEAARRMRLDAILCGQVHYRRDSGLNMGHVTLRVGDPTVAAEVNFELINVPTGQTLASDSTTASYTGELTPDRTSATSEKKVLGRLVSDAAAKVVDRIVPHQAAVQVPLAVTTFSRGSTAVNRGNKLAQQGDWTAAAQEWQTALDANPQSDAALYNLGLAAEARQDYMRARECYAAATQVESKPLYETAIQRVERASREQPVALAQVQRTPLGPNPYQVQTVAQNVPLGSANGDARPWTGPRYPRIPPPVPQQTLSLAPNSQPPPQGDPRGWSLQPPVALRTGPLPAVEPESNVRSGTAEAPWQPYPTMGGQPAGMYR